MKTILILLASVLTASAMDVERMADAIYLAEGGSKARVPYGVLSVKVSNEAEARRVTINSIRNNLKRWEKAGRPGTFFDFMAARWTPAAADPTGNRNWKRNVKKIYGQTTTKQQHDKTKSKSAGRS